MKKKIVILKLGGSLITNKSKPFTPRISIIKNLSQQIKTALLQDKSLSLIIGNGGGSFPHYPALKYKMKEGIKTEDQKMGYCCVQDAASRLNRLIVAELIKVGVKATSINPSSMIITNNGEIVDFFMNPILGFLKLGITPVFYGDIVYDKKRGSTILSTEMLINILAKRLQIINNNQIRVVQNGITAGILDERGNIIPVITKSNCLQVEKSITKTAGFDVTGGMMHKLKESLDLANNGIQTLIINGSLEKNLLINALLNKPVIGTVIS